MPHDERRSSRASSSTGSSSSITPTISGFYGADAETSKNVVMLVNDVRQIGGVEIYRPFIRLLKDCAAGRITRKKLIVCVHDLLKGHPFLLSRFCKLVPPAMVEERDRREVRRIEEKEEYRSKASLDKELVIQIDVPRKAQSADVEVLSGRHGREKAGHGLKHCWPLSKKNLDKKSLEVSSPPASGPTWSKPWAVAHHWLRSNRVSDDPTAAPSPV